MFCTTKEPFSSLKDVEGPQSDSGRSYTLSDLEWPLRVVLITRQICRRVDICRWPQVSGSEKSRFNFSGLKKKCRSNLRALKTSFKLNSLWNYVWMALRNRLLLRGSEKSGLYFNEAYHVYCIIRVLFTNTKINVSKTNKFGLRIFIKIIWGPVEWLSHSQATK